MINIIELVDKIQNLIPKTAAKLNLNIETFSTETDYMNGNNYLLETETNQVKLYLINHKNLNFLNELLNISEENKLKLKKLSEILNIVSGEKSFNYANSQKITIQNHKDDNINIKIADTMSDLTFIFCNTGLIITNNVESLISNPINLESIDEINDKIDELIFNCKIALFNHIHLSEGKDETSIEFKKHTLTREAYINSRLETPELKYILGSTLLKNACTELGLSTSDLDGKRSENLPNLSYMDKHSYDLNIDYKNKSLIKKILKQVCLEKNVESEIDSLVNLLSFYQLLSKNNIDIKFHLTHVSKKDRLHMSFYKLSFGDMFTMSIGNNMKNSKRATDIIIRETSLNDPVYKYTFRSNILKNQDKNIYLTNNISYIYKTMLNSIRKEIGLIIEDESASIGEEQINLYKMIKI